jgi:hypothetical protein
MDWSAFYSRAEAKDFVLLQKSHLVSGVNPASFALGTRPSFSAVEAVLAKDDQSPPSNAKLKNEWSNTFSHPLFPYGVGRFASPFRPFLPFRL